MSAAPGVISRKWRLEQPAAATGSAAVRLVVLVSVLTLGAIGTLSLHVGWLFLMWLGWFVVAWLGARVLRGNGIVAGRLAVVGALAWAATMAGVALVSLAGPGHLGSNGDAAGLVAAPGRGDVAPMVQRTAGGEVQQAEPDQDPQWRRAESLAPRGGGNSSRHPAFGKHTVLVLVGAPWPGIEGNGNGAAADRIPFAMGIDAMLVNFGAFALLFGLWLRRAQREQLANLLPLAALAAAVFGLAGGWRLIVLFD